VFNQRKKGNTHTSKNRRGCRIPPALKPSERKKPASSERRNIRRRKGETERGVEGGAREVVKKSASFEEKCASRALYLMEGGSRKEEGGTRGAGLNKRSLGPKNPRAFAR